MIFIDKLFPFQRCENICDCLHDLIMSPAGPGRLPIGQCKVAWKNMISAKQVKVRQTDCTLAELTENEMFWKHRWAWHHGVPRSVPAEWAPDTPRSSSQNEQGYIQSLHDQNQSLRDQLKNNGGGARGGR